jgi:hypothetical protein
MVRHGFGGGRRYVHVPFVQRACTMHLSLHVLMDRSFRGSLASMARVNFWRIPTWQGPRRPVCLLVDRCKCFVPCLRYRNHEKINLWGISIVVIVVLLSLYFLYICWCTKWIWCETQNTIFSYYDKMNRQIFLELYSIARIFTHIFPMLRSKLWRTLQEIWSWLIKITEMWRAEFITFWSWILVLLLSRM